MFQKERPKEGRTDCKMLIMWWEDRLFSRLTLRLNREVGETEAAEDHQHQADRQSNLGALGDPEPQAIVEIFDGMVDPRMEAKPRITLAVHWSRR